MSRRFGFAAIALALLALPSVASAGFEDEPIEFSAGGYWKTRGVFIKNLFMGQTNFADVNLPSPDPSAGRLRSLEQTGYLEHGLRFSPKIRFRKIVSLNLDLDILDGVIWGDNNALAAVPLFAGAPSNTGIDGQPVDSFVARRVWLELNLPVGILKVGRQPSHWGMGLLANKGDGLDADFGDFRHGSTVDRILFATKPVSIVKSVLGSGSTKSNVIMAFAYDQLADDPVDGDDPDVERLCETCAPQILFSRPGDDVQEWVGVLAYKNEHARIWTNDDIIQAGAYVVYRSQATTKSSIWVYDGHAKFRIGPVGLETELVWITGISRALDGPTPLDKFMSGSRCIEEATPAEIVAGDSKCKDISIWGGVVRGGYYTSFFDAELEVGRAPGDDTPTDDRFTGFPFHADYNVGIILYEQVLAARTADVRGHAVRGLWSKGGVYNSRYIMPKIRLRPLQGLTMIFAFLWAQAYENDAAVWAGNLAPKEDSDMNLGWEIDFAARYDFYKGMHVKLEAGMFKPGKALWLDTNADARINDEDRGDTVYSAQMRLGFQF